MRRKDREIKDYSKIIEIINKCKVCRLAMTGGGMPYLVPLNFGYVQEGESLTLYFHSAAEGRKIDMLRQNPNVCFELDCDHQLTEGVSACESGYLFKSVIGEGTAAFVEDDAGKREGLNAIMLHQTGKSYDLSDTPVGGVAVIRVSVQALSGKARS